MSILLVFSLQFDYPHRSVPTIAMPYLFSRFDIFSFELHAHLNPGFLTEPIAVDRLDVKKLKRYSNLIHEVVQAFKKVRRYETYFTEFYPSSGDISPPEALEHHIHAYLQDITILSNKIEVLLNDLKNDLRKVASNKDEVCASVKKIRDRVLKSFKQVKKHRNPHHHRGNRFLDYDIIRAGMADAITNNPAILDLLKSGAKEYLEQEASRSFARAKQDWCEMAKENETKIAELMERLFLSIEGLLYQFLGIQPILMHKLTAQLMPIPDPDE